MLNRYEVSRTRVLCGCRSGVDTLRSRPRARDFNGLGVGINVVVRIADKYERWTCVAKRDARVVGWQPPDSSLRGFFWQNRQPVLAKFHLRHNFANLRNKLCLIGGVFSDYLLDFIPEQGLSRFDVPK